MGGHRNYPQWRSHIPEKWPLVADSELFSNYCCGKYKAIGFRLVFLFSSSYTFLRTRINLGVCVYDFTSWQLKRSIRWDRFQTFGQGRIFGAPADERILSIEVTHFELSGIVSRLFSYAIEYIHMRVQLDFFLVTLYVQKYNLTPTCWMGHEWERSRLLSPS